MFIDEVHVNVKAGKGGNGAAAFIREKSRPWGGPAGGDGGRGGSIIFEASQNVDTLIYLYRKRNLKAPNGENGGNKNCSGRAGEDIKINIPLGTIIRDAESGEILHDLTKIGEQYIAAAGGKGGRGNQHFATSTHQTPYEFEKGVEGQDRTLHLELKLIADVGLVGLPNAGKSTLLSRISDAHPKIAPYPFTTKEPHLGIVDAGDYRQIVVADLPGLIEGAHAGAGLGDEFLKHVERTSILVHLVDVDPIDGSDPVKNYKLIEKELLLYSKTLHARPRLVVANKADLDNSAKNAKKLSKAIKQDVLLISGVTGEGLKDFLKALIELVFKHKGKPGTGW